MSDCTCHLVRYGDHLQPAEWEQNPYCREHPAPGFLLDELLAWRRWAWDHLIDHDGPHDPDRCWGCTGAPLSTNAGYVGACARCGVPTGDFRTFELCDRCDSIMGWDALEPVRPKPRQPEFVFWHTGGWTGAARRTEADLYAAMGWDR